MKSERGAVLIEAALSLTMFMFAILTIYSMYHISLAQARVGAALNATAKEISQYSYVYGLTGANAKQSDLASKGGAAQAVLSDNLSEVNGFYDGLFGLAGAAFTIGSSPENVDSFLAYALNSGLDRVKGELTGTLSRSLMKKHFGSDPDGYLEGLGIEGGLSGLSFSDTRVFADGGTNEIILVVSYKVKVIELLNVDITLNFEQCAKTLAWSP